MSKPKTTPATPNPVTAEVPSPDASVTGSELPPVPTNPVDTTPPAVTPEELNRLKAELEWHRKQEAIREQEANGLRLQNHNLRNQIEASAKAEPVPAMEPSKPGWFRCHLRNLPPGMAVHVHANNAKEAEKKYCQRMGVVWTADGPATTDRIDVVATGRPTAAELRGKYTREELVSMGFEEVELEEAGI